MRFLNQTAIVFVACLLALVIFVILSINIIVLLLALFLIALAGQLIKDRVVAQLGTILCFCILAAWIVTYIFKYDPFGFAITWAVISAIAICKFWDDIVLKVEPNAALVIKNQVTGTLRIVGAGLHTKTFWIEKTFKEVSLMKRALTIKEDQYDTKDSIVLLSGTLEYRPDVNLLHKFILISEADLINDITAKAKSIIGEILSAKESETAVKERPQIQKDVYTDFKEASGHEQIEDAYGIEIIAFSISSIKLDPELQRARTQEDVERRQKKSERIETEAFLDQVQMWVEKGHSVEKATEIVLSMHGRGKRIVIDMQGSAGASSRQPNLDLKIDDKD